MEAAEFGDIGYAVLDVEALMLGPVKVVEQVAFVLFSLDTGKEIYCEKHMVYQPYDVAGLTAQYKQPLATVQKAVDNYCRITGDNYVHDNPASNPSWSAVRNRVRKILRRRAVTVYAKGAQLENTVFGTALGIRDLEWWGCPKYPESIHDPLLECRFFGRFVPELAMVNFGGRNYDSS